MTSFNGGIYENLVSECFVKLNTIRVIILIRKSSLFYRRNGFVTVEVKADNNRATLLIQLLKK